MKQVYPDFRSTVRAAHPEYLDQQQRAITAAYHSGDTAALDNLLTQYLNFVKAWYDADEAAA